MTTYTFSDFSTVGGHPSYDPASITKVANGTDWATWTFTNPHTDAQPDIKWSAQNTQDAANLFGWELLPLTADSGFSLIVSSFNGNTTLCYTNNNNTNQTWSHHFDPSSGRTSTGGGSSSGGGFLSNNPSITNLVVTKGANDAQVEYVFDWNDITSYTLDVVRSGVVQSYVNQQVNASGGVISNLTDNDYWYIKYSSNPILFVPTQIHSLVEWTTTSSSVVAKFYGIPSGGGQYYLRWYGKETGDDFANRVQSAGQLITLTWPKISLTTYQVVHYAGSNLSSYGQYDVDYSTSYSVGMLSKGNSRNFW